MTRTSLEAQEARARCDRCGRPLVVCYCAHVRTLPTRTRVVIVQHPREAIVPINTARIARLCLPRSELIVTDEPDQAPSIRALAERASEGGVGLLFPSQHAAPIGALGVDRVQERTLVVIDGTWWQAEKLLKKSALLSSLPRYGLSPQYPSRYRIRREPSAQCLSTIEALSEALSTLEGASFEPRALLAPFEAMVESQLAYARAGAGRGRHKKSTKPDRRRQVPDELARDPTGVVLAYAESNAWPYDAPSRPAPELVHWVAERLDDGARAHWVIAPRNDLAPDTTAYTGLDEQTLRAGVSIERFAREWRAFSASTPALATWNTHAVALLSALEPHHECPLFKRWLDLRPAVARFFKKKPGTLAEASALFGPLREEHAQRWAPGRAGARIVHVAHIARALRYEWQRPLRT